MNDQEYYTFINNLRDYHAQKVTPMLERVLNEISFKLIREARIDDMEVALQDAFAYHYTQLQNAFIKLYLQVGLDFARHLMDELEPEQKSTFFSRHKDFFSERKEDLKNRIQREAITQTSQAISGMVSYTRDLVRTALSVALRAGLTGAEMAREARRSLQRRNRIRAKQTAITEVTSASSMGMSLAAEALEVRYQLSIGKRWITRMDGKERESHRLLNRVAVALHDFFVMAGNRIKFPGDPKLPASLRKNCRCVLRYFKIIR